MVGRRIQHVEGQDPYHELSEPGDYCLVTEAPYAHDGRPSVYFLLPVDLIGNDRPEGWTDDEFASAMRVKRIASCAMPPHVFRECSDGSLEIRESILVTQRWKGTERQWHGYLDEGNSWRTI